MIYFSIVIKINIVWISSLALLFLPSLASMVVQFIGGARLLKNHDRGIPYTHALLIFALLTVGIYTFIGGFRAVVLTDTIKGTVMILGTIRAVSRGCLPSRWWCRKCGQ